MATKSAGKPDVSKARLAALKKLGLLKDVSARGTLSAAQKKSINAQFKKHHAIADAPKGTYHKQDVSQLSPGVRKSLEKSGVSIINGTAFVRTENYKSVKIVRKKYKDSTGAVAYMTGIERETANGRKKSFTIIGSRLEQAQWAERLTRDWEAAHLKEGQFVALQAFDNSPMMRSNTITLDSLLKYESQIKYHDNAEKVREGLKVVVISVKDLSDFDANTKSRKQVNAEKYQRKKKEKKTQTKKLTGRVKRK
jgi:hypothetical protein